MILSLPQEGIIVVQLRPNCGDMNMFKPIHRSPVSFPKIASDAELWCFELCLNKRLCKQSKRRWFETPSRSLWLHCTGLSYSTGRCSAAFCINFVESFFDNETLEYIFANQVPSLKRVRDIERKFEALRVLSMSLGHLSKPLPLWTPRAGSGIRSSWTPGHPAPDDNMYVWSQMPR